MASKISLNTSNAKLRQLTKSQAIEVQSMHKKLDKQVQKQLIGLKNIDTKTAALQRLQLSQLQSSIKAGMDKLSYEVETMTKNNMKQVSAAVVDDTKKWLSGVGFKAEGTMINVPSEVVEGIASGKVYEKPWSLSESIWGSNQKTHSDIEKIVAMGAAQGKSSYDIAKDLETYVNPSAKKDFEWSKVYPGVNKKIDYNAQRLSRTMVAHAYDQSVIVTCKMNPFVTGIQWQSAHAVGRTCSLCLQRDGMIYEKSKCPMDHPCGLCTMIPIVQDSYDDISGRIADWYHGKSDKQLDKFYDDITSGGQLTFHKTKSVVDAIGKASKTANTKSNDIAAIYKKMLHENDALPTTRFRSEDMPTKFMGWYKSWSDNLTEAESGGIHTYTGGAYESMNEYLRGRTKDIDRDEKVAIKNAESALSKAKLPEDIIVRRGSDDISLAGLAGKKVNAINAESWLDDNYQSLIGKGLEDKGFMSTSPIASGGFSSRGVEYFIKLPKGTEAAFVAPISNFVSEKEILINAGTRFIVNDIKKDSLGGFAVYMTAVVK